MLPKGATSASLAPGPPPPPAPQKFLYSPTCILPALGRSQFPVAICGDACWLDPSISLSFCLTQLSISVLLVTLSPFSAPQRRRDLCLVRLRIFLHSLRMSSLPPPWSPFPFLPPCTAAHFPPSVQCCLRTNLTPPERAGTQVAPSAPSGCDHPLTSRYD